MTSQRFAAAPGLVNFGNQPTATSSQPSMPGHLPSGLQSMSGGTGGAGGPNLGGQTVNTAPAAAPVDQEKIYQWIQDLTNPEARENALLELR